MISSALLKGCACALALSVTVSAQVLMLDFGPTAATGASLTNSAYHTAHGSFSSNTTWNTIQTADVNSGLFWSGGTAATGVSVNLGATTDAGITLIGLANVPSGNSALGTAITGGVYANSSVGKDGIFTGASGNSRSVGLQIGGLAAGTYDIYVTGRNTNISAAHVQNFYAGASASGDFDYAGYSTKGLSFGNLATSQTASWSEDANYVKLTVTLTSGEFLNIASIGGTGEARGFLNAIQIVNTSAVPEPGTFALLAGLLGLGTAAALRRRR